MQEFNISSIPDNAVIVIIGRKSTGKSTLIKDLLYSKQSFPIGTVVSGTEEYTPFYSEILPSSFIHYEFNATILHNCLKRQDALVQKIREGATIDHRLFVCLDDCMYDNKWLTNKYVRALFTNGRHGGILTVLALQYVMRIPDTMRSQIDYVFILREDLRANRQRIYDQFASVFPTFEHFNTALNERTDDYECLVIDNTDKSKDWTDRVFWYKAVIHPV